MQSRSLGNRFNGLLFFSEKLRVIEYEDLPYKTSGETVETVPMILAVFDHRAEAPV